jgi:hypothetical protein
MKSYGGQFEMWRQRPMKNVKYKMKWHTTYAPRKYKKKEERNIKVGEGEEVQRYMRLN